MSKTVLILFAGCVGLSLLSLHLVKQMHAGQATIAELQEQVATLERQQQQRPSPPAPAAQPFEPAPAPTIQPEQAAPSPPKEAVKTAAVKPLAAPPAAFGPMSREERIRSMQEHRERQRQLMQDPDYREAMRMQHRSSMSRQYPDLATEMGLTPDQTDQFFEMLAEHQMRSNEQAEMLWDMDTTDPTVVQQRQQKMQQQMAELQKKNEAEIAAQFGQDKLQAWKEYQSTLGARHQTEQLRNTLSSQGVPVSDDASRAMVKALAEAQKIQMQEYSNQAQAGVAFAAAPGLIGSNVAGSDAYERQLEFTKKHQQRTLDAISPYLTFEQREAVRKEHEAQIKMQEAQIRIMRAQSKSGANDDAGIVTHDAQWVILPR